MTQASHLALFELSQEKAKSFDDDLDFCPSLTAKELSEIILASILAQKESQAKEQRLHPNSPPLPRSPTSPTSATPSRAITIVDPTSRTPLYIPTNTANTPKANSSMGRYQGSGRYSGSTTPATAAMMTSSDSYFNIMPTMNGQQQQHHQQQVFNTMYGGAHSYQFTPHHHHQGHYSNGMMSPTSMGSFSPPRLASRIPIVNPDNGNVVAVPEAAPAASPAWHQNHFVAVR